MVLQRIVIFQTLCLACKKEELRWNLLFLKYQLLNVENSAILLHINYVCCLAS